MALPSIDTYRNIHSAKFNPAFSTVGYARKLHSDMVMEATWDDDIQSRLCYMYDYYHDDQPTIREGMTYSNETTKFPITVKFLVSQYSSLAKDQVEYHILFKPSQKIRFSDGDDLYYYESDYRNKYGSEFPLGMYIDIPDDKGVYKKWIIVQRELGNQFLKYIVLPCNYWLHWIEESGGYRYKRRMWGVRRSQSSYNSGLVR